jgi:tetratricopeptide (TPR) repeat protein
LWCLCAAACQGRADHERIGDSRYAERAFPDAVAEYRLAARLREPSPELMAKLGAAALHAGSLVEAAEAYGRLAAAEPAAREEAADGLVRVVRAATTARDVDALSVAVAELRRIAPLRLPAALSHAGAAGLASQRDLHGPEGADVLLAAVATARPGAVQDSLLVLWSDVAARAGRCDAASHGFEAVLRRVGATSAAARAARGGLASCALEAGRSALAVGALDSAVSAFARAVHIGTPDSVVRMAWVLTGDAQWAAGDSGLAAEAYGKAMAGGDDSNPIVQRAREQLDRLLGLAPVP